jgi:hypothetical protein
VGLVSSCWNQLVLGLGERSDMTLPVSVLLAGLGGLVLVGRVGFDCCCERGLSQLLMVTFPVRWRKMPRLDARSQDACKCNARAVLSLLLQSRQARVATYRTNP